MALPAGLTWEVRTTGNANNGGGFIDRLPGTSVDYSQQNAAQLSKADLACLLASVTLTSVTGGFTAGMVGNLIQIRAGGVNFVAGFYEIVLVNSANSVNLDRTPVAAGNGTGGLGEVGGALITPETFLLNGVGDNVCFVKSGTYAFTASRIQTNTSLRIFGYDISRTIAPTGNNRPLIQLGAFWIENNTYLQLENLRFTGSATQLILGRKNLVICFNCYFENTNNAGSRYCIFYDNTGATFSPSGSKFMDCEFVGTAGATSYGFKYVGQLAAATNSSNIAFLFCFFHDLSYGFQCDLATTGDCGELFFKCTFARIAVTAIEIPFAVANPYPVIVLFCSFYSAGSYFLRIQNKKGHLIYGNTFDSAVLVACYDSAPNFTWFINSNDFWNNGAVVSGCFLDANNIGLSPLWVNPAANDFNFGPGSPCIDNAIGIRLGV